MRKRFLSTLLAICMVLSLLPVTAFADEPAGGNAAEIGTTEYATLAEAISNLQANETLTLLNDVTNTDYSNVIRINLPSGAVLDGGGYKLEGNIAVYVNAEGGTVQNVKFKNIHNAESKLSAVYASGLTGTLTIQNCEFDTCDWDAIQTTPKAGAVIDIQNNIFRNSGEQGINTRRYVHVESASKTDFTVTVTKNKFYDGSKLLETALEVYYPTDVSKVKLNGNYVNEPISTCIILNSSYPTSNRRPELALPFSDEALTGEIMPQAAFVRDTYNYYYYPTLQQTIDAAGTTSTTITLLTDVTDTVTISEGQSITFNLSDDKRVSNITNNGTLTVSGTNAESFNGSITNNGTLNLKGDAATVYQVVNNGTLNITSGATYNLSNISGEGTILITGGTFTTQPDDSMLAEWYIANALEDGTGSYKVAKMTVSQALENGMVASSSSSGNPYYKTVSDAVSANNISAYLQKDVNEEITGTRTSYYGNLYANGYKLTGSLDITTTYAGTASKYYYLRADKGGIIELSSAKYNGDLRIYDGAVILDYAEAPSMTIGTYNTEAQLTIKDANITGTVNVAASGTLNIEGGTYLDVQTNIYYISGAAEPSYTGVLNITGGTFSSDTVTIQYKNHTLDGGATSETVPLSNYIPDGYKVIENQDGTYTVQMDDDAAVAKIGEKLYLTLAEAVAKAQDGDTIHLLKNYEGGNITIAKAITIETGEFSGAESLVPDTANHYTKVTDGTTHTFALESFTVTFNSNDGTPVDAQTVSYNGTATKPANPVRDGYVFDGWYTSDNGGETLSGIYDFSSPITVDITLYAKWTEELYYTVSFTSAYGTQYPDQKVEENGTVQLPVQSNTESYAFNGWRAPDDATYSAGSVYTITADTEFVAVWTEIPPETVTYTVTFDSNGGSAVSPVTVIDGEALTVPAAPTRSGYDFGGWQYGGTLYQPGQTVAISANATFVAQWTEQPIAPTTMQVDFLVTPETVTAAIVVKDANGQTVTANEFGGYDVLLGETYTYTVSASGYVTKTGTFVPSTAEGGNLVTVTLTKQSSSSSSGGSSSSSATTTTATNPDGSTTTTTTDKNTGTVTETTKNPDGSTTTVITAKDGASTETNTTAQGVTGTVVTDKTGEVTSVEAAIPAAVAKTGETVTIPVTVAAADSASKAAAVEITVKGGGSASVEIPVTDVNPGLVAVVVSADGAEEIVKTSIVTEDGVALNVDGRATVKVVDNTRQFIDVEASDWFNDAVTFVAAREIMGGTGADTFSPDVSLTRSMMAQLLYSLENRPEAGTDKFHDVASHAWYADAVNWAAESKVVAGYENGAFGPEDTITREQMVVILYGYARLQGLELRASAKVDAFRDGGQTSDWARTAMEWALTQGLLSGRGDGILAPKDTASRAEVAQVLVNFCRLTVK